MRKLESFFLSLTLALGALQFAAPLARAGATELSIQGILSAVPRESGGIRIGITTAFLQNMLTQSLIAQASEVRYANDVSADVTFEFQENATVMPFTAIVRIGEYEYEHTFRWKTHLSCTISAAIRVDELPLDQAKATIVADGDVVKSCEIGGDLGALFEDRVRQELNSKIKLQPDGTLWSTYLGKTLKDDEHTADVFSRMYLLQELKGEIRIGARFCTTTQGNSVCLEVVWPHDAEKAAIDRVLERVPPPVGTPGSIPESTVKDWIAAAPVCPLTADPSTKYPSKDGCETGDMTLFAGLLCNSGYADGCKMVAAAQEQTGIDAGRWWRSPNHIRAPGQYNEFSGDQTLGIMAFLTSNVPLAERLAAAKLWRSYIVKSSIRVPSTGDPAMTVARSCAIDEGGTCNVLGESWFLLNAFERSAGENLDGAFDGSLGYSTDWMPLFAASNATGYRMHLIGVQILVLKRLGLEDDNTRVAARILSGREPENPFFLWLVNGRDKSVEDRTLKYCPAPGTKLPQRTEWSWERAMAVEDWKKSMYWECVFMAGLLNQ
jgi:hypothetical protein